MFHFIIDVRKLSFVTSDVYIALNNFISRMAAVFRSLMKTKLACHGVSMNIVMAILIVFLVGTKLCFQLPQNIPFIMYSMYCITTIGIHLCNAGYKLKQGSQSKFTLFREHFAPPGFIKF